MQKINKIISIKKKSSAYQSVKKKRYKTEIISIKKIVCVAICKKNNRTKRKYRFKKNRLHINQYLFYIVEINKDRLKLFIYFLENISAIFGYLHSQYGFNTFSRK